MNDLISSIISIDLASQFHESLKRSIQGKDKYCSKCGFYKEQCNCKITNADRIRNMSDEELAKFITAAKCCILYGDDCGYPFCHSMNGRLCNGIKEKTNKDILDWLQSEVEE